MTTNPRRPVPSLDFTPLRERVRDVLRRRIIDGTYPPGLRIVERDLAAELSVSRIPIREAFRMLESEGFVSVVPRRGVIVKTLSEQDVAELFDVREALEVLACRRVAENATKGELRKLRQLLNRARRAIDKGNLVAVGEANASFHDEIIRLAHNELLAGMLEPVQGRLHWLFRQHDDPEELWHEHSELLAALSSGDPDRAAEQALRHVRVNRRLALRLLFGEPTAEVPESG